MPSKLVLDREKSARSVIAGIGAHAPEITEAVARELSPYLQKGEAMPDIALLLSLLSRRLKHHIDSLVKADNNHEAELADDAAPRDARDDAAEKVRLVLVDIRDIAATAFGAAGLTKLGLSESIPDDPSGVASRAKTVVDALLNGAIKLPKSRRASLKFDRKGLADELHEGVPDLSKALNNVAREEREAKTTLAAKNAAMAAHDHTFSRGSALLAAVAAFAGLDSIAASIRPSARRTGRTAAEDTDAAPDAEEAGAPGAEEADAKNAGG